MVPNILPSFYTTDHVHLLYNLIGGRTAIGEHSNGIAFIFLLGSYLHMKIEDAATLSVMPLWSVQVTHVNYLLAESANQTLNL
jgi:hypothetical protein